MATNIIKSQMKLLNLKQETLAPMMGLALSTMNKYINHPESMTIKTAKELCKILHINLEDIIGDIIGDII